MCFHLALLCLLVLVSLICHMLTIRFVIAQQSVGAVRSVLLLVFLLYHLFVVVFSLFGNWELPTAHLLRPWPLSEEAVLLLSFGFHFIMVQLFARAFLGRVPDLHSVLPTRLRDQLQRRRAAAEAATPSPAPPSSSSSSSSSTTSAVSASVAGALVAPELKGLEAQDVSDLCQRHRVHLSVRLAFTAAASSSSSDHL